MKHPLCLTKEEVTKLGKINSYPYSVMSDASRRMLNDDLKSSKLFHSDIYYIREALHKRTGYYFPLTEVERAARLEGWEQKSYRKF